MNEAIQYIEKMTGEGADFDCALFISADHYKVDMKDLKEACIRNRDCLSVSQQSRLVGCFKTVYGG